MESAKDRAAWGEPSEHFLWGSATAAYQCEGAWNLGGKGQGEWDYFNRWSPKNVNHEDGTVASDFYHRFREDIDLMAEGGQNTFRFSLSWSRILPQGFGEVNEAGVAFYNEVIDYCLERGVEPNVTLFHYDLPYALAMRGGWSNADMIDYFCAYAKICFERFGDRVKYWTTVNEPHFYSYCANMTGNYPPNHVADVQSFLQWEYHLMLASAKAVKAYHDGGYPGMIGVVHDGGHIEVDSRTKEKEKVFRGADFCENRMILCPALEGSLPPELGDMLSALGCCLYRIPRDEEILSEGVVDFLGMNIYCRIYVTDWNGSPTGAVVNNAGSGNAVESTCVAPLYTTSFDEGVPHNQWGREILPRVMCDTLMEVAERYGNPLIMVTENGHGCHEVPDENSFVADDERIEVISQFISSLEDARRAGVRVIGYYLWSTMDLYSWINGYDKRYGLVRVDFENGGKRIPKKSWYWYRDHIAAHPYC